jgi:hypothetical protein
MFIPAPWAMEGGRGLSTIWGFGLKKRSKKRAGIGIKFFFPIVLRFSIFRRIFFGGRIRSDRGAIFKRARMTEGGIRFILQAWNGVSGGMLRRSARCDPSQPCQAGSGDPCTLQSMKDSGCIRKVVPQEHPGESFLEP